jgi:YidC/Oxa1 family membrane protein insertase
MQAKNWLLFLLVAIVIWVGWGLLSNRVPPKKDQDDAKEKKEVAKKDSAKKDSAKKDSAKKPEKPPEKEDKVKREKAVDVPAPISQEVFTLGKDTSKYHLTVKLTTLGGGVRAITLNKFEGADEDGRGTGRDLFLVPDDPLTPSYLLYLYADAGKETKDDPHALDTLGRMTWKEDTRDSEGRRRPAPYTDKDGTQKLTFEMSQIPGFPDLTIRKTYELEERTYHLGFSVEIEDKRPDKGKDQSQRIVRYHLAGAHGLPIEGKWYTSTYRNAMIGVLDQGGKNLARQLEDSRRISIRGGGTRVPENQLGGDAIQYAGVVTQFFAAMIVVDRDKNKSILDWARPMLESTELRGRVAKVWKKEGRFDLFDEQDNLHRFVLSQSLKENFPDELEEKKVVRVGYRLGYLGALVRVAEEIRPGSSPHKPYLDDISVSVNSQKISLGPGESKRHSFLLYHGPVKVTLLRYFSGDKAVSVELIDRTYLTACHLNTLTDYPWWWFWQTIQWTTLVVACTNLMHWLLNLLHTIVPVYGLCIILLTVIVRGLMFPISRKQALMSQKMQALAPEMKKIQEKYKTDPQAKTQAIMDLYRRHGVNPLGGCLPLLMQMPIFLGLYYAFQESIFFRLAEFIWIPNLAAPDMLIYWTSSIPMISTPDSQGWIFYLGPYLNVLPILAVTLMLVQQKYLSPPPTDENMAAQMKIMKYMMVFMGLMFYKVAAGLCIYFIASSLWGLAERKLLPKKKPAGAAPAPEPGKPQVKGKKPLKTAKNVDGPFQKVKDWWADVLKQAKKK